MPSSRLVACERLARDRGDEGDRKDERSSKELGKEKAVLESREVNIRIRVFPGKYGNRERIPLFRSEPFTVHTLSAVLIT